MATHCYAPVYGKRIRVTELDKCGVVPAPGTPNAYLSTDGFVTVSLSAETEDGAEITVKNASGGICISERGSNSFKRMNVEITFCGVNPSLLAMTTNAEPYADCSGDVAGITIPEGPIEKQFALELWTGISGQACEPGAEEASGYILLPFVNGGVIGDLEIGGEDAVTFSLTGAFTKGQNQWGIGPYGVVLCNGAVSPLPTALDPLDHLLLIDTGVAPPPSACDPVVMPPLATAPAPTPV